MFSDHAGRSKAGALLAMACVLSLAAATARADGPVIARYAPGDEVRTVYFDPSVPTGKFRTRIADAAATWRALPGVAQFEVQKSPSMALSPDPCADQNGVPIGGIIRGPVAGSATLAENRSCVNSDTGQLIGFRQTYNQRLKFYIGSGEPPTKKQDLQAIATHELGHSEGWTGDHYSSRNNAKICANKPKQATMCPASYSGTKRLRTLAKEDKQPVLQAYSQPSPAALEALGLRAPAGKAFSSAVAPGGAGARGCLAGLLLRIHLRRGGDTFDGSAGRDLVNLARGDDLGFGKGGDDCIVGGLGADDLRADAGNDTIIAGPGPDIIDGGPGSDLILGGLGDDQIYAADGFFDRIRCGRGFDRVFTADPGDVLIDCEMTPADFTAIPVPPSY
jgi:hypothetical protein